LLVGWNHTHAGGGGGGDDLESQQVFLLILVFLLIICFSLQEFVASRTKFLTEGSFACLVGLVGGLILLLVNAQGEQDYSISLAFPSENFFDVLLPPIIFYQGFSMHKMRFFKNAVVISLFGLCGTIVSFAMISLTTAVLNIFSTRTCLRLGAIMAATDSVAVLQVLNPDKSPLLHSLVFGEGVVNDASSIVLLRSIRKYYRRMDGVDDVLFQTISSIFYSFFSTFTFSAFIGISVGLFSAVLMRLRTRDSSASVAGHGQYHERGVGDANTYLTIFHNLSGANQCAFVVLLAYLAFVIAETLHLSGIMTLFCCGLVMSHYTYHNLEESAKITTTNLFHSLAMLSEVTIYIFVGMDSLYKGNWTNVNMLQVFALILLLLLSIVISRLLFVFPICILQNFWSSKKLSFSDMMIIIWAGTLRGAVSVALVMYSFAPQGEASNADRESSTVIAAVMFLVVFSTIFLNMGTKPIITCLNEESSKRSNSSSRRRLNRNLNDSQASGLELPLHISSGRDSSSSFLGDEESMVETPREKRGWLFRRWTKFDDQVMKPIFGGDESYRHLSDEDEDQTE
jgi:NhaP-type Na+/H+ or K+/H+ antiporter